MRITLFKDTHARSREEREVDFDGLVELIRSASAPSKNDLPLLKLATFGEMRSPAPKNSLRHDANVLLVYGLECDYDAEKMTFEEAVQRAADAKVEVILYTSPSHTPSTPRWRALFPFAGQMLPTGRRNMADRANALFGGTLARETWTLSQSFYYGKVHEHEHFRLVALRGAAIDTLTQASEQPYVKQAKVSKSVVGASVDDLPPRIKRAVKTGDPTKFGFGEDRSALVFYVVCSLLRCGWPDDRILDILLDPQLHISSHVREQGSPESYARKQVSDAHGKVDTDWVYGAAGTILPNHQDNIKKALGELGARFSYNQFIDRGYVNGAGPLRQVDDHEVIELRLAIDREFGFLPSRDMFFDMMDHLTHADPVHPVRSYLASLEWDGVHRLGDDDHPGWLTIYGGAEDTLYTRAVGRLILVAACRRVRQPGAKFDEMLVLVNPKQGTDKSTALQALVPDDDWFTDSLPLHATEQRAIEQMKGRWIVECGELNGMHQSDIEGLKVFLSRRTDRARMAYARMPVDAPRQCVFFGTTNSEAFLRDTQNRRFWPVRVTSFNVAQLTADRDQLWAEAAIAEATGESVRLNPQLWDAAAAVQLEYRQEDPWVNAIRGVLRGLDGKVTSEDIWKILDKPVGQRSQTDNRRMGEAMRELGFERVHVRIYGQLQWGYKRAPDPEPFKLPAIHILWDPVTRTASASHEPDAKDLGFDTSTPAATPPPPTPTYAEPRPYIRDPSDPPF